jgi:hypothetical protein
MLTPGSQLKETVQAGPEFYCPNCHANRPYKVKQVTDARIVCVIPIYHANQNDQVLECQVCKNGFEPAILDPSNKFLFKLVAATRAQLLTGTSPGSLKVRLMSDGLKEEFIDRLIGLAQN